jgi:hypothetical protein
MKDKIRSLLGSEMSLGNYEFKPIILLLGILLFIGLAIPLLLVYSYLYLKSTLLDSWKEISKGKKYTKYKGVKGV